MSNVDFRKCMNSWGWALSKFLTKSSYHDLWNLDKERSISFFSQSRPNDQESETRPVKFVVYGHLVYGQTVHPLELSNGQLREANFTLHFYSMSVHAIPLSMKFRYLERTTASLLRLELKVCSMLMVYRMDFLRKHFCQIYSISGLWDFVFFKFKKQTKKNHSRRNAGFYLLRKKSVLFTHFSLFVHIMVHCILHAFHTPSTRTRLQFLENWYIGEIPHPCILTRWV